MDIVLSYNFSLDFHSAFMFALLLLLSGTAVAIAVMRDILACIILFSIFSLLMALIYLMLQAPDVAITEAAVGAGVSTIFLLASLVYLGREHTPVHRRSLASLFVLIPVGCVFAYSTLFLPNMGDPDAAANQHIADYYLKNTPNEIGIPNVVTAVLASYRGYDTLGEVAVVFTALTAVLLLLGGSIPKSGEKKDA